MGAGDGVRLQVDGRIPDASRQRRRHAQNDSLASIAVSFIMAKEQTATRRRFLSYLPLTSVAPLALTPSSGAAEESPYVTASQPLPNPRITFPTDRIPKTARPKRIAAITTAYYKYSHADDIITKFIEGYSVVGRTHLPRCRVVSLYVEQFLPTDIGRGMATRYKIPLFDTAHAALTLGGSKLAVDGVLLIGEHGIYPYNDKGQHLYPRRRLFDDIVRVFRRSGKSVPVYNDKHFSYSWNHASWMYKQSKKLKFPMMAGSSVPVTWRKPAIAVRPNSPLTAALGVGYGSIESYGFHTLETMQTVSEKRKGGESGIRSVQAISGQAVWRAAKSGAWDPNLLLASVKHMPIGRKLRTVEAIRQADPQATVFLIEHTDGFRSAAYLSRGPIHEFGFAGRVRGQRKPFGCWCPLLKPQRDHFSFLCNHIEVMFRTGKPSYPVERTYSVTGALAALLDSDMAEGKRIKTPQLNNIRYQAVADG